MNLYNVLIAKKLSGGGGGGSSTLIDKNISANGTYNATDDSADGYKKVVVNVPNTYVAGDEGKVVSSGALVSQSSATYTTNNTYDTTLINSVTVNVQGSSGQQIGIQTPNANPLAMLYALEQGTAKTGEFTLATTLPNTATTIFDAQDTTVKNFVIMAEGEEGINTGTTSPASFLIFMIWLQSSTLRQIFIMPISCRDDNTSGYVSIKNNADISIASSSTPLLSAYWDWANGVLSAKGQYNKHASYTPFKANTTYRWVAW